MIAIYVSLQCNSGFDLDVLFVISMNQLRDCPVVTQQYTDYEYSGLARQSHSVDGLAIRECEGH